jgi:hypothetical protein
MLTVVDKKIHNWSSTNPNDLQEDIMESLWNYLQLIYKHQNMILKLTKSNQSKHRTFRAIAFAYFSFRVRFVEFVS